MYPIKNAYQTILDEENSLIINEKYVMKFLYYGQIQKYILYGYLVVNIYCLFYPCLVKISTLIRCKKCNKILKNNSTLS